MSCFIIFFDNRYFDAFFVDIKSDINYDGVMAYLLDCGS
mgnify:CR=1 FL=1